MPPSTTLVRFNATFCRAASTRRFGPRHSLSGIVIGFPPNPDHDQILASAAVNVSMPFFPTGPARPNLRSSSRRSRPRARSASSDTARHHPVLGRTRLAPAPDPDPDRPAAPAQALHRQPTPALQPVGIGGAPRPTATAIGTAAADCETSDADRKRPFKPTIAHFSLDRGLPASSPERPRRSSRSAPAVCADHGSETRDEYLDWRQ
jgi:hypothetical protein